MVEGDVPGIGSHHHGQVQTVLFLLLALPPQARHRRPAASARPSLVLKPASGHLPPCLLGAAEITQSILQRTTTQRLIDYVLQYAAAEASDYPAACQQRYHGLPFLQTINSSWQRPVCTPQVRGEAGATQARRCMACLLLWSC